MNKLSVGLPLLQRQFVRFARFCSLGLALVACAKRQPPNQPPTPESVTRYDPGGDAHDPEQAALERLLREPFGMRRDRARRFRLAMLDRGYMWRSANVPLFTLSGAYRYGDKNHAVVGLYFAEAESSSADACFQQLVRESLAARVAFGIQTSEPRRLDREPVPNRPVAAEFVFEAKVQGTFSSSNYLAAVAVYAYRAGTCLAQGFAVHSDGHQQLAEQVRKRWLAEAAGNLKWLQVSSSPADEN